MRKINANEKFSAFVNEKVKHDEYLLNNAIKTGIQSGKRETFDKTKLKRFALSSAAAVFICLGVPNTPHLPALQNYFLENSIVSEENSKVLGNYLSKFGETIIFYLK
ncbi:MAG: hypothetical protein LBS21_02925 [Clostridiales bacterium]|nr:hypothetical protein [Clostridiales bacterium]